MSARVTQALLILLSLGAVLCGGLALQSPRAENAVALPPRHHGSIVTAKEPHSPLDSVFRLAAKHAPFRVTRIPASISYDPDRNLLPGAPSPPAIPKPSLVLSGIVSGAVPAAVLEGFPGVDGPRVVRAGEVVSGLQVRAIRRDAVVVTGLDTTWTLRVRVPWK